MRDLHGRVEHMGRYKLMLDYADFNSAHTLRAQKIVVSELFGNLDVTWKQWLIDSFDNMQVQDPDGEWRRVRGTLMSGHRMTSIINTILNAAYLWLVVGRDVYLRCNFCTLVMMYLPHLMMQTQSPLQSKGRYGRSLGFSPANRVLVHYVVSFCAYVVIKQ